MGLEGTWKGKGTEYGLGKNDKTVVIDYKIKIVAKKLNKTSNYKLTITLIDLTTCKNPAITENIIVIVDSKNFIAEDATGNGINSFSLKHNTLTYQYDINGSPEYGNVAATFELTKKH